MYDIRLYENHFSLYVHKIHIPLKPPSKPPSHYFLYPPLYAKYRILCVYVRYMFMQIVLACAILLVVYKFMTAVYFDKIVFQFSLTDMLIKKTLMRILNLYTALPLTPLASIVPRTP